MLPDDRKNILNGDSVGRLVLPSGVALQLLNSSDRKNSGRTRSFTQNACAPSRNLHPK